MDPTTVFVLALGLCLLGVILIGLLILFTPIMSWLLIGAVAFLGIKMVLTLLGLAGASPDRPRLSAAKLISETSIKMMTEVRQAGPERFLISARGVISNYSDRIITGMKVWCRAEALYGSDTDTGTIPVTVRPGETQTFVGEVADRFYGVAGQGTTLRVAPKRHFCRVDELVEG